MNAGLASFVAAHNGTYVMAPGGLGAQCVDLADLWLIANGGSPVRANAIDWATAAIPRWTWEMNGPVNYPPAGALVVWGTFAGLTGADGHVAICVLADGESLVTYDQNWSNQPCQVVIHTYAGVLGWWAASAKVA